MIEDEEFAERRREAEEEEERIRVNDASLKEVIIDLVSGTIYNQKVTLRCRDLAQSLAE